MFVGKVVDVLSFSSPSAIDQLALLIGLRQLISKNALPDEELEQSVKQACLQTGLIEFIKKMSESVMLVTQQQNLDAEFSQICYYVKLEFIWIITNIAASVHS